MFAWYVLHVTPFRMSTRCWLEWLCFKYVDRTSKKLLISVRLTFLLLLRNMSTYQHTAYEFSCVKRPFLCFGKCDISNTEMTRQHGLGAFCQKHSRGWFTLCSGRLTHFDLDRVRLHQSCVFFRWKGVEALNPICALLAILRYLHIMCETCP